MALHVLCKPQDQKILHYTPSHHLITSHDSHVMHNGMHKNHRHTVRPYVVPVLASPIPTHTQAGPIRDGQVRCTLSAPDWICKAYCHTHCITSTAGNDTAQVTNSYKAHWLFLRIFQAILVYWCWSVVTLGYVHVFSCHYTPQYILHICLYTIWKMMLVAKIEQELRCLPHWNSKTGRSWYHWWVGLPFSVKLAKANNTSGWWLPPPLCAMMKATTCSIWKWIYLGGSINIFLVARKMYIPSTPPISYGIT